MKRYYGASSFFNTLLSKGHFPLELSGGDSKQVTLHMFIVSQDIASVPVACFRIAIIHDYFMTVFS